jgi:hypothetical protein
MMIDWLRGFKQDLEEAVQAGGRIEIPSADHMRDPLHGIIDDNGEMIARRGVLSDDDGIAPTFRVRRYDGWRVRELAIPIAKDEPAAFRD